MRLFNARLGFANNSSSSHSIIFLPGTENDLVKTDGSRSFGWGNFTLASKKAKLSYLAAAIYANMRATASEEVSKIVASAWTDGAYKSDSYIDHESLWDLPRDWSGKSLDAEFVSDLRNFLTTDGVVILGGNDNDDGHPLGGSGETAMTGHIPKDCPGPTCARKDGVYWTLFNRDNGSKYRISFDKNAPAYGKSSAPELVDVKITDACSFGCSYCYQGSTKKGSHADSNYLYGVASSLGKMRVFEAAIGGGEPTEHPDFVDILGMFVRHGVTPNFTTKSLAWMRGPLARKIHDLVGSFAYSVETAKDVEDLAAVMEETKYPKGYILTHGYQCASVQAVLGVVTIEEAVKIAKAANKNSIRLTLLGYKRTGRGAKVGAKPIGGRISALKKSEVYSVGIDTVLASEYEADLKAAGVSSTLYHTEEGKFSMYVDAVTQKAGPSSYCDSLLMKPLAKYASENELLDLYRKW